MKKCIVGLLLLFSFSMKSNSVEEIKQSVPKDTILVYYSGSTPYAFTDESSNVVGFNPDILHEVFRRNNFAYLEVINNKELYYKYLQAGKIDLTITSTYRKDLIHVSPYDYDVSKYNTEIRFCFLTRRFSMIDDYRKLKNKKVCYLRTIKEQSIPFKALNLTEENTIYSTSLRPALKLLNENKVDAIIGAIPCISYYIKKESNINRYKIYSIPDLSVNIHYAVLHNPNKISVVKLDSTLAILIKNGFAQERWNYWCTAPISKIEKDIHCLIYIVIAILLIGLIVLFYCRSRILKSLKRRSTYDSTLKTILDSFPLGIKIESNSFINNFENKRCKSYNFSDFKKIKLNEIIRERDIHENQSLNFLNNDKDNVYLEEYKTNFKLRKIRGTITIYTDITNWKLTNDNLNVYENFKNLFFANLSYEVIPLLNNIVKESYSLTENESQGFYAKISNELNKNVDQLLFLVDSVIELSKEQTDKLVNKSVMLDLNNFIKFYLRLYEYSLRKRKNMDNIKIVYDKAYSSLLIKFNINLFTSYFAAILSIMCNHIEEGEIHLGSKIQNGSILFYYSDTGNAFNEDEIKEIRDLGSKVTINDLSSVYNKENSDEFVHILSQEGVGNIIWKNKKIETYVVQNNYDREADAFINGIIKQISSGKLLKGGLQY